ncbi:MULTISPECIES: glycosyltransferase family 4 protein [Micromonospora]|uniref:Glycosyltransferase involved in cell wall bisynthesis n=1 Tax=Micromonospora yangpuensis TaxID=683228 RepID=A0A1C6UQS3_9ACTN|nr:glycosyltransferase family 4 protein [Micromonospora yangpuensis]GGM07413.1 glycosyltransferase WbuB [Micromonospora yangpuensis]SCL56386.1 Glycosyltransferase involved in cell wall bisynthesis [Micromonospora yangpuensis]
MRIGMLSYHFPPEPAFLAGSLAEELAARGHQVRVLTGFPDYPGGHVYPGWRQRWHHETHSQGLTVRRVPRLTGDGTTRGPLVSHLSFAASAAGVARRFLRGVDALYVCQHPAGVFATAAVRRVLGAVPTVLHVQGLWPGAWAADTPGRWADRLATATRGAYRSADRVVVGTSAMRDLVVADGAREDRVRVVLSWTDERLFRPVSASPEVRRLVGGDGRCVVLHAGTIGAGQRLETAIRAAVPLERTMELVLVGSGEREQRVREFAAEVGARNVRFVPRRPALEMPEWYAAADYQLVATRDLPELSGTVPTKLPAALACAAPVVVSAGGDTAEFVESARAGLSCPPEDWAALADRFWLAAAIPASARLEMGRRGRDAYLRQMSLRAGVDRVERLLHEVATESMEKSSQLQH